MANDEMVNVRYMVDDVGESIAFYTKYLGFELLTSASPAFADVKRGNLRLLLAGSQSSAARPMPDGRTPGPGGKQILLEDPSGNVVELFQPAAR
jgi:Glyoxalase/Bleomycin resistance protein/Dioxygenase superfamily